MIFLKKIKLIYNSGAGQSKFKYFLDPIIEKFMDNEIEVSIFRAANNTNLYEVNYTYNGNNSDTLEFCLEYKYNNTDKLPVSMIIHYTNYKLAHIEFNLI